MKSYSFEIPSFDIGKTYDEACITVASANVRCYTTEKKKKRNWYYRGPYLVQTLIDINADIIGLQETMPIHYNCIKPALRGYGSFIDYREECKDPEGCPIFYNLSKFELIDKGTFWLSETPEKISKDWGAACYRICSYAILKQKSDGKELAEPRRFSVR